MKNVTFNRLFVCLSQDNAVELFFSTPEASLTSTIRDETETIKSKSCCHPRGSNPSPLACEAEAIIVMHDFIVWLCFTRLDLFKKNVSINSYT